MNTPPFSLRFFVIGGAILILSGFAQALIRPRNPNETPAMRYLSGSVVRAVLFVTVGVLAIMVGMGAISIAH
jgi:uncharacterized membrane protein YccC